MHFEYDEMAFKFTYRCNGMPSWYSVGTPAKGHDDAQPYVALAGAQLKQSGGRGIVHGDL